MHLKEVRQAITESIQNALIAIWHESGPSIVRLGKLERVEFAAYSESYKLAIPRE